MRTMQQDRSAANRGNLINRFTNAHHIPERTSE